MQTQIHDTQSQTPPFMTARDEDLDFWATVSIVLWRSWGPWGRRGRRGRYLTNSIGLPSLVAAALVLSACQPTISVEPLKKPFTININIKIDADIRVKPEETAKEDITSNPDIS